MAKPTADEIRAELEGYGIDETVLSDEWIDRCRDQEVIPHVKDITRMEFEGIQTIEEYYNGNGTSTLMLNRKPIVSLVKAEFLDGFVLRDLAQSIDLIPSEGMLKARSILVTTRYQSFFSRGDKNWKITYTYGYADYPADISRAIRLLVCCKMLAVIGARTGGGSVQVQSHGRNYGSHGKYTDIRKEFGYSAYGILKPHMTSTVGA